MVIDTIHELAAQHLEEIIALRRHLHMYPELSFQEEKTSLFIQEFLQRNQIPFSSSWAGHGIVAMIEGKKGNTTIALRADIDALPIQEINEVPYKSRHQGIMHACGHDVHTASLLGAALILSEIKDHLEGNVKLIFQPAEEKLPGGASLMIAAGVLQDPSPKAIIAQHVHPLLPAGIVGFREGQAMASGDEITLSIRGKGGHGATPHQTIDPVLIAAQVITALQSLVSRSSDPIMPSVLTFGKINSTGGAFNVIPDEVIVLGTFRTFDEKWRTDAHLKISAIAQGVSASFGGSCEVRIEKGYPVLINEPELTKKVRRAAVDFLGEDRVVDIPPRLTSEDFAYYSHHIPGCFYRLGVANQDKGITSPVHTPTFDIEESALETGAGLMAWIAASQLQMS